MEKSRPTDIKIIIGLVFFVGIVLIWTDTIHFLEGFKDQSVEVSLVVLFGIILSFATAYGLWNLKKWALYTTFASSILLLVAELISLSIIGIIIMVTILYSLYKNRKAFI